MEIDPKYADCIVRRYQEYTGKQATLENDGRSFDEVAQEGGVSRGQTENESLSEALEETGRPDVATGSHWFDVYPAALRKLSVADREFVVEVMAHRADSRNEPHQTAWARLGRALVEAAAELNAPFFLTATEMMF